jgi:hypothetical protein
MKMKMKMRRMSFADALLRRVKPILRLSWGPDAIRR